MRHRVVTGLGCRGVSVTELRAPDGGRGPSAAALLPCDDCHGEGSKQHPDHGRKRVICLAATWGQFRWPRSTRVRCRGKGSGQRCQATEGRTEANPSRDGRTLTPPQTPEAGGPWLEEGGPVSPVLWEVPGSWRELAPHRQLHGLCAGLSGHFLRPCSTLSMCVPRPRMQSLWPSHTVSGPQAP